MVFVPFVDRRQDPTTSPLTTIVGRNTPLPPGTMIGAVLAGERGRPVGVAEQVLVEAGQQVHGRLGGLEARSQVVRRHRRPSSSSSCSRASSSPRRASVRVSDDHHEKSRMVAGPCEEK